MTKYKYRGKYTNARDCAYAYTTETCIGMVEVNAGCLHYGKTPFNLVPVDHCQYMCKHYRRRED
jgi:hypothetical protein